MVALRRLVVLSDSLSSRDGVGCGAAQILRAWRRAQPGLKVELLLARDHPVHERACELEFAPRALLPPAEELDRAGPRGWLARRLGLSRALRAASGAPQLVFSFKDYPLAALGWSLARSLGVPFWSLAHGTYAVRALSSMRHRRRALAMYRGAAGTIAVSAFTRARLLEQAPLERLHIVPNGVDARLAEPRAPLGAQPWTGRRYLATIAACKERKGLHLALESFAALAAEHPELHWFIAGREHRSSAYAHALRARIEALDLSARVHLLGEVSAERKADLLAGAEVHVFTPVTAADGAFEGFGLPYLEAAILGTWSLGTRASGAEEALGDGALGQLEDPRVESLAAALRSLLAASPEQRQRRSQAAAAAALQRTWDRSAARIWKLISAGGR